MSMLCWLENWMAAWMESGCLDLGWMSSSGWAPWCNSLKRSSCFCSSIAICLSSSFSLSSIFANASSVISLRLFRVLSFCFANIVFSSCNFWWNLSSSSFVLNRGSFSFPHEVISLVLACCWGCVCGCLVSAFGWK